MSSVYSQPLTRRSTATDESTPVHTPYDDILPGQHSKSSPGSRYATRVDGVHVRSPSETLASPSAFRQDRGGDGVEPLEIPGSYFSPRAYPSDYGQGCKAGTAQLTRRGTTKELIGRYEAMGSPSATDVHRHNSRRLEVRGGESRGGVWTEKKEKSRSPIRQSFRNLLSVFRKKPRETTPSPPLTPLPWSGEQSPGPTSSPSPGTSELKTRGLVENEVESRTTLPSLTLQIPDTKPTPKDQTVCLTPLSAHSGRSGPLMYLSRIPLSNIPPVWMNCNAQLHSTHILVTWETPQGNPAPKLVPFTACADVRSLSQADLSEIERGSLPDDKDWKVFELLFEGRAREKFAAASVTDRATWVSAIWDAILLAQENKIRSPAVSESVYTSNSSPVEPRTRASTLDTLPRSAGTTPTQLTAPSPARPSTVGFDRDLPPLPPTSPVKPAALPKLDLRSVTLTTSALPSLPAPPVTPVSARGTRGSYLSPGSPPRSQSPSIRNLDQRSMVKQRLAQIEGGSPRAQSPVSPTRSRLGSPSPFAMRRQESESGRRSVMGSILNSYLDPGAVTPISASPISTRSPGLTTLASRMGSPPPLRMSQIAQAEEKSSESRLLDVPKEDRSASAPASRYSGDEEQNKTPTAKTQSTFRPFAMPLLPSLTSFARAVDSPQVVADKAENPALGEIQQGIRNLQGRSVASSTNIIEISSKVDEVLAELRRRPTMSSKADSRVTASSEHVDGQWADVKGHLLSLQTMMKDLKNTDGGSEAPNLSELHAKLDSLAEQMRTRTGVGAVGENAPVDTQIADVLLLLRDAEEQRASEMEQQTDCIRYLNELNTWLEAFVKHGTSQIESMAAGVQQLCKDLRPVSESQDVENDTPEGEAAPSQGGLLSDIRKLLEQSQEREQNNAELHASVNSLIAAVQEDLRRNAEARNMLTTESVIGMIDRQRQDQERMLKALATELSNDIRGERLRFVEAMKEATAINVQIHVEEFKKELTREVLLMTQEVTRLQRERQGLEQQIADLFAFYAKQKQSGKVMGARAKPAPPHVQTQFPPALTGMPGALPLPSERSIHGRPLPSPAPSPTRSYYHNS